MKAFISINLTLYRPNYNSPVMHLNKSEANRDNKYLRSHQKIGWIHVLK